MKLATFNSTINNGGLSSRKLPTRIKVMNFGVNETLDEPVVVNEKTCKVFSDTQRKIGGLRIALDFNHNTVEGSKAYIADKEPRAVAAYGSPVLRKDGIYLENLTWTPSGEKHAKDYEDLSPAPILDEDNVVIGLHSVALTPRGAIYGLHFYSTETIMKKYAISDKEALAKTKELEEHEKAELATEEAKQDEIVSMVNKGDKEEATKLAKKLETYDAAEEDEDESPEHEEEEKQEHMECNCASCKSAQESVHPYEAEDHKAKYGDVAYADKKNHKYPVDTEKHVRAAWSYINMPKNQSEYSKEEISSIKSSIKAAGKKFGIEYAETKSYSANVVPTPNAYKNTEPSTTSQTKQHMIETLKSIAPEKLGMKTEAEILAILKSLVAEWAGVEADLDGPITNKENSQVHQFSAKLQELEAKVATFAAKDQETVSRLEASEKNALLESAKKEGKVVPFSAESIAKMSAEMVKEMISNLPKNRVPLFATTKILSADNKSKKTMADASAAIEAQINS